MRESVVLDQQMADINVKHLLAVQLIDRELSFASSHDIARVNDPAVLAFQEKLDLGLAPEIEFRRPVIELTLTDGQTFTLKAEAVRGSPANPMSRDEVIDKATGLMLDQLGDQATRDVVDMVWQLGPDVAATELIKKLTARNRGKGD
jgi:2-methylcitrate dehydratase PrpD